MCGWLEALGKLPEGVCPRFLKGELFQGGPRGPMAPYSYLPYLEVASRQNLGKARPGQGRGASFS